MADTKFPYFLLGLGVGAALGVLYAPRPGEETREELRNRANEGRDYVRQRSVEGREYVRRRSEEGREYARRRGGELRDQAGEILERGRGAVHGQRDQLANALEAGRRAYRDATTEDAPASAKPAVSDEQAEASGAA